MERLSVEEFEKDFDEYFSRVENGESFLLTIDGEDKAVIMPYDQYHAMEKEVCGEE